MKHFKMSRKKTVKTVAVPQSNILKNVFKSTTQRVVEESDASLITKAVKDAATQKAEQALLEQELAKPSAMRNPALMRKYGTQNLDGVVDNYPNLTTGDKYKIVVTIPDDPAIPIEHRPKVWTVTIEFEYKENTFNFVFPISRANQIEPDAVYKLDGADVYLDADYNVVANSSTYDLYEALLDWRYGERLGNHDLKKAFKKYGIVGDDDSFDFRVRGHGFLVSYTKTKSGSKETLSPKKVADPKGNVTNFILNDAVDYYGDKRMGLRVVEAM